jgi:hypothetical protein
MLNFLRRIFSLTPIGFGIAYFMLIPIFALIYLWQPACSFHGDPNMDKFVTCLYFSTVTITTLGFGDISPTSTAAQVTVIAESVIGLFTIGFFLNSLAQTQAARITDRERTAAAQELQRQRTEALLRFDKLIQLAIRDYTIYTWAMTTPIMKRQSGEVKVNPNFVFPDLEDIFGPSLLGADLLEPVISIYFIKQAVLISDVRSLLINVDLDPWPRLEEACHKFLENCNAAGIAEGLVDQGKNEQLRKKIQEFIRNEKDDPELYDYGHIVNPVIVIYKLIKENLTFLEEYDLFIQRIKAA